MKIEVKVPGMGESISEATIGTILATSGSAVKMDSEILELETDKVNQVLYAPQTGLLSLSVKAGDTVLIGQVIGTIETESAAGLAVESQPNNIPETKTKEKVEEKSKEATKGQGGSPLQTPTPVESHRIRHSKEDFISSLQAKEKESVGKPTVSTKTSVSPLVSQTVTPQKDVTRRETRQKMTKIRKVIANRLLEAQHTTAMLTTFNEVDLSQVMAIRERDKEAFAKKYQAKLGFMSFFVKATISALEAFPGLNSYIDGEDIVHREYYDIGIAVGTERGLFVPVVRDCDQLSFAQIEKTIEGYAVKAKEGKIVIEDLQGGGFTITNGGVYGSLLSTPILNPPQSGILGMHKIQKRAVVVDDQIVIRPMMYIALSYDHRIVDGKEAVSFLVHLKNVLEDPARLFLEV